MSEGLKSEELKAAEFGRNHVPMGIKSSASTIVGFCEGFRTTTDRDSATGTGAVVRKRPGKEPAGSWGKECAAAAYGDLIAMGRVAEAVKSPGCSDWG
jgi:hypothetical protein